MLREISVSHLPGVGRAKQQCLADLGLFTVQDILHYFPFRYEDKRVLTFEQFPEEGKVVTSGVVEGNATIRWQGQRSFLRATVRIDSRVRVTCLWFNQSYLKSKLTDGRVVLLSGRYDRAKNRIAVSHTDFGRATHDSFQAECEPVYRVTRGLTSVQLQAFIGRALETYGNELEEFLPIELVRKYRLISHRDAVRKMHQPQSNEDIRQAHRRLAFEEFFLFQLQIRWFRRSRDLSENGVAWPIPQEAFGTFERSLPNPLTAAQKVACNEIATDLASSRAMSRLLQGDVGSGKTWVALWSAYAVSTCGAQTAFMAPTEVLAEQHFRETRKRLEPLGLQVALLTGSTPERARREIIGQLRSGMIDVLVGTHALLTEDVEFRRLGLVITDEQHRFGVSQRAILRLKGNHPDVLFLSATPIPRTLALAVYGDLDVSLLKELPSGRKPVVTKWIRSKEEEQTNLFIRKELAKGRQVFIVAPLVEESEQWSEVTSAVELAERLTDVFAGFRVGLLHGKMSSKEKEAVMKDLVAGTIHVLVSTTVIEVGIDVPNATIMMIYDAERFGLAQLHQLRGRVGRGAHQSFCFLVSEAKNEMAKKRLQTMVDTNDGFIIAERDLELRGPGEFLGNRQSGLPEFTVGDLSRDLRMMEVARDEAAVLISQSDFWLLPAYEALRKVVQEASNVGWKD